MAFSSLSPSVQILGLLIGIFMIYMSFLHLKRKEFGLKDFVFWVIVWIGFLFSLMFSEYLKFLQPFGFGRPLDFLTVVGLTVILIVVFLMYGIAKRNERGVKEIVRKLALSDSNEKKDHNKR